MTWTKLREPPSRPARLINKAIKGATVTAVNDLAPPWDASLPPITDPAGARDTSQAWGAAPDPGMRPSRRALFGVVVFAILTVVVAVVIGFLFLVADPAGAAGGCGGG
jgi:hypothetical protein